LKPGEYTVKVKVIDSKNKVLDENNFKINVEKLKVKHFVLGGVLTNSSDVAFDSATIKKVKSSVKLPTSLKLKYSYTNGTDEKHVVKMVRELVNESGKVLQTKLGKWDMNVGEKDSMSFTQSLASSLSAGNYSIRIRAYDWTTKELLAENSVGFSVELK
jgi:hypothetical protein